VCRPTRKENIEMPLRPKKCYGIMWLLEDPLAVHCDHKYNINILYKPGNILSS